MRLKCIVYLLCRVAIFIILYALVVVISCMASESLIVTSVIDGDTLIINNSQRVRLIGVDTPEKLHPIRPIEYFASEASEFVKGIALGKEVRLEFDTERVDKYGRVLAYVYFQNGTCLNEDIIRQGYGFAYTKYPFKYSANYVSQQVKAQANGKGFWRRNGFDEFDWLLDHQFIPFEVFEMGGKHWAIRYKGYVKVRVPFEGIQSELERLRQYIREFHEEDLREKLTSEGWAIYGGKL